MDKQNDTNNLFDLLNKAFSMNYTCLRIANQDMPFSADTVHTRDTLFKTKTTKEIWLREKMKDAATQRMTLLTSFMDAKRTYFNELDMEQEDQKSKDVLMENFNKYYQTNKTFAECFDGFEILDEDFKSVFTLFDEYKAIPENRINSSFLLNVYYNYLDYLTDKTMVTAVCDIIDTLYEDLNSSGYRTFYYGKPTNPAVSKLSREEVNSMILKVHEVILQSEKETKEKEKEFKAFVKRTKKTQSELATQEFLDFQVARSRYAIIKEKLSALSYYITMLDNRLTASGKDIDDSKMLRFGEGFLDLTAGINVFDENNRLKIDHTYIHDLEIKYLDFLFKGIGIENPLRAIRQKSTAINEKQ